MKFAKYAAAAIAAASLATAAYAQDAATVTVGATVTGPDGAAVGTVESVADGVVTVDTGKHKAPLPTARAKAARPLPSPRRSSTA